MTLPTKTLLFFCALFSTGFCEPLRQIPKELFNAFTMDGQIPVVYKYRNDSYSSDAPIIFTSQEINHYLEKAGARENYYYEVTDTYLYAALDQFKDQIAHKNVAVIGTVIPWYESILLSYSAYPTTIEYNKIISEDPRIEVMTVEEYKANPKTFDVLLSISSIEHDGLGRYGDPINPLGDLETMEKFKKMLPKGGLLFLSVPVGQDCLVWNLHRIYGKLRLTALLQGWRVLGYFGFSSDDLGQYRPILTHQPVFVLTPL